QFWINTDDRDVGKYLRYFTLLTRDEVEALERVLSEKPESREAQRALAMEVTTRGHGADAARVSADASKVAFDRSADPHAFSAEVLDSPVGGLPAAAGNREGEGKGIDVLDACVVTGLVKSKGDARRLLQQGGLYINGEKLAPESATVSA